MCDGWWDPQCSCCMAWTPIIINIQGGTKLSSPESGVMFDLGGTGTPQRWSWPLAGTGDGWLVWDRNGNGQIDDGTELFGNAVLLPDGSRARNGFVALAQLDANRDGLVDERDPLFSSLRVWIDTTRDGHSEAAELFSLESLGINAISVETKLSSKRDRWGNVYRWRAPVHFTSGVSRYAYDVILAHSDRVAAVQNCTPVDSEVRWSSAIQ